jgi:hypothetical protein
MKPDILLMWEPAWEAFRKARTEAEPRAERGKATENAEAEWLGMSNAARKRWAQSCEEEWKVVLVEVGCPTDELVPATHLEKRKKYRDMLGTFHERGFATQAVAVVIGALGRCPPFTTKTLHRALQLEGNGEDRPSLKEVEERIDKAVLAAVKQSHTVWRLWAERNRCGDCAPATG